MFRVSLESSGCVPVTLKCLQAAAPIRGQLFHFLEDSSDVPSGVS